MSRRARRPLNACAVEAADNEIYRRHEGDPRPNPLYDADGNRRPLSATDPAQADLRHEWMDLYVANGGEIESGPTNPTPPSDPATPCVPPTCTITSETVSTARTNRARTRVGVGERVTLTFSLGAASWTITGAGTLSGTSGSSVTFTAGDRNGTATITATGGGCTASITLTVVEPSGAYQRQYGATLHNAGSCSAGFEGVTFLTPLDVSFENIEVHEGVCNSTAHGSFVTAGWDNLAHPSWAFVPCDGGTDATGSKVLGPNFDGTEHYDHIFSGQLPADCAAGDFTWVIPWEFRVAGGTPKVFTHLTHFAVADGARKMTMSKGGVTVDATEP